MPDIVSVTILRSAMPRLGSAVKRGRSARLVVNAERLGRGHCLDRGATEASNEYLEG